MMTNYNFNNEIAYNSSQQPLNTIIPSTATIANENDYELVSF